MATRLLAVRLEIRMKQILTFFSLGILFLFLSSCKNEPGTVTILNYSPGPISFGYYPNSGSNWNDYVRNDGADIFSATGVACNPATDNSCLHGGGDAQH